MGVGNCKGGTQTCLPDGTGFGSCTGETLPDPNGEDCAKVGDEDCDGTACSDPVISTLFGDAGEQRVTGMAVDKDGNTVIAGYFMGSLTAGSTVTSSGSNDYFLIKFDPAGQPVWIRRYGDTSDNGGRLSVTTDAMGNVVISGEVKGQLDFGVCGTVSNSGHQYPNVVVAKLTPQGSCVWAKSFGDAVGFGQSPSGVAVDAQGNVVVAGSLDGSIKFGSGGTVPTLTVKTAGYLDAFLAKLAPDGSHVWSQKFADPTGTAPTTSRGIAAPALDPAGNIYMTGSYSGKVAIGAKTLSYAGSGAALLLAKIDQAGSAVMATSYGGETGYSTSYSVAVSGGRLVITGNIADSIDFGGGPLMLHGQYDGFVAAFDLNLAHQWSMRFGDPNDVSGYVDAGTSVAIDKDGNVLLTGQAYGTITFDNGPSFTAQGMRDVFLAKLSPNGTHLWSKLFGDGTDQIPGGVGADPNTGNVVLAGSTQGSIDFGTGTKPVSGGYDMFLATFQP